MIINIHQDQAREQISQTCTDMRMKFPCGILLAAVPEKRIAVMRMWGDDQARLALVHCLATDDAMLETVSRACLQAHMIRDDAKKSKGAEREPVA